MRDPSPGQRERRAKKDGNNAKGARLGRRGRARHEARGHGSPQGQVHAARARAVAGRAHQNQERRLRRTLEEADGGRRVARAADLEVCGGVRDAEGPGRRLPGTAQHARVQGLERRAGDEAGDEHRAGRRRRHVGPLRAERDASIETGEPLAAAAPARVDGADLQAPQTGSLAADDGLRYIGRDAIEKAGSAGRRQYEAGL